MKTNMAVKVMKKLGMEFVKEFDNEKVPVDSPLYRHVLYRIKSLNLKGRYYHEN